MECCWKRVPFFSFPLFSVLLSTERERERGGGRFQTAMIGGGRWSGRGDDGGGLQCGEKL